MADPWWLPGCLANMQTAGYCNSVDSCRKLLCTEQHCTDSQNYWHRVCNCDPPYQNGCTPTKTPNCCSYTAESPIYVIGSPSCYCCCGCFAHDTPVAYGFDPATGLQNKAIADFAVGDPVYVADGPDLKNWSTRTVQFSSGTGPGGMNTLLKIDFQAEDGPEASLYANRAQLFLMPDGKLKRAGRLVPGDDHLVLFDGTPVRVLGVTVGRYKKGVHHIATSREPARSMAGHLIVAEGVVSGDYALQVAHLDEIAPELMVEGHAELPEVGTPEYARAYAHLAMDDFSVHYSEERAVAARSVDPDDDEGRPREDWSVFEPFGVRGPVHIPAHAQHFVTEQQAEDIRRNAPAYPPTSSVGMPILNYLFKQFQGFYPQVTFYMDVDNPLPNAYSFNEYGKTFVVVTAQLARTVVMQYEGLAVAIAHELGHLYGGDPVDRFGYSCTGVADYAAVAGIIPYVWMGSRADAIVQPGIEQVKKLFDYIDPQHRGGRPGNTCNYISIDCRIKSLEAGAALVIPLPSCAGGPPDPTLTVVGATAGETEDGTYVDVEFSAPVDPATAAVVSAYMFQPTTQATAAAMVEGEPARVRVTAGFEPGVEYGVWVYDVLSADGHPLIPGQNSAYFTLGGSTTPIEPPAGAGAAKS